MSRVQADMESLLAWLSTYPQWNRFGQVRCESPSHTGLLPKSAEETSRQEDLSGNCRVGCRYTVSLFWQMDGAESDEDNAARLLDFQNWVREQSVCGLAPQFGDEPLLERIRATKGGFTANVQTVTYTVTLVADFMKVYEVN